MTLDFAVSRATMLTRTVEAALHSDQTWTVEIGGIHFPAERVLSEDAVSFWVHVPPLCFVEPPNAMALYEGDVMRSCRPLVYPGSGGFALDWTFDEVPTTESVPA